MPVTTKLWNHLGYLLFFINNCYHDLWNFWWSSAWCTPHTCFQHILLKAKRQMPWYSKQRKTDVLLHGRRWVLDTCFQRVLWIQRGKYPNIRRKIKTHISHKIKHHIILISQLAYYISERSIHVHQHLNLFQTTIQFMHNLRREGSDQNHHFLSLVSNLFLPKS